MNRNRLLYPNGNPLICVAGVLMIVGVVMLGGAMMGGCTPYPPRAPTYEELPTAVSEAPRDRVFRYRLPDGHEYWFLIARYREGGLAHAQDCAECVRIKRGLEDSLNQSSQQIHDIDRRVWAIQEHLKVIVK